MHRLILLKSHLVMIITFILVFGHINVISSESISSQTWSNIIQDFSSKIHDYKSDDKIIESHPLNEGFILLTDNPKKPSPTRTTTKPSRISQLHNTSSTTCKTIIMVKIKKQTSPPNGHIGRRLLNEPSYDTDIDTLSIKTPIEDDRDSFLKVDNMDLNKQLLNVGVTMDGSGETTEDTTEQTSETTSSTTASSATTSLTTPAVNEQPKISPNTTFILSMDCENRSAILKEILQEFNVSFNYDYDVNSNSNDLPTNCSGKVNVTVVFTTDTDFTTQNNIFEILRNVSKPKKVEIFSVNKCDGRNETVIVNDVTSCYLIDLCNYCGNPLRGVCQPEYNVSKCRCFANEKDPSQPYVGEFCLPHSEPIKTTSIPSRWTPIIVGILAGLTGLFCAITLSLWTLAFLRRRGLNNQKDLRVRRLWHLPRARLPTQVASENDLNNTISTPSSHQTDSDYNRSISTDSTFFKDLDQKMGENLRATITRPNTQAMLASLPSDTMSTLSSYDPIDELDSIIDNEDVNTTFHDPLNELYEDNEILEFQNPNIKLPRPNVDLNPTGLFSYFYKK